MDIYTRTGTNHIAFIISTSHVVPKQICINTVLHSTVIYEIEYFYVMNPQIRVYG